MAYRTCCLLAEIFLLMLLLYTVCSNGEYGYFNRTSKVTIPDVTLTLGQGSWIQVVFRTCAPSGEILKYQKNGKDLLSVSMHNTSLELSWSLNSTGSVVSLGSNFNNNTWHQFDIKFFLGVVYFNVSKPGGDTLFSEVLANRTFQSFLLDVRLTHVVMELGQGFTGCLWEGPGVDFSAAGAVSSGVLWSQCPLTSQIGCSPIDSDVDDCLQIPCQHGGTCVDGFKNYTCLCKRNFNGTNCENDLRYLGCVTNPCLNNGTCTDTRTSSASYICSCIPGFTGLDCEVEIDECRSNPCRQGKCINLINAYQCDCTGTGYNGPICDNDIDECVSSPCGQGTCHNSPGSFTCTCPPGYAGLCQEGVDECVSSPCQNLGTCHDLVDGYNCTCRTGFTGTNCERNIDDCVGQTCPGNNTRCEDLINGFQCVCQYGYTGTAPSCVDIDECQSNPCINSGTCNNGENYFECSCVTGFNGTFCENNIDDCASNPCKHNATCSDKVNSFSCLCPAGFTGQTCSVNINDCANVTCQNSGSCTDLVADYRCDCTAGWTGRHCETDINECESRPCLNGATCNNLHNSFTCSCSPGYDGDVCEHNIDDCNPHPCHNNASCIDRVNDFFCNCSAEWMGKTCEQVFNACMYYTPCKNNASCLSQPPSRDYTCTCAAGFEGKNCSVNIDDCVGVTCESFQVCKDHINSYTCDCPAGWTGSRCETDIDECAGQPCLNGGTCINGTGFYTCQCHTSLMNLTRFLDGQEVTFYTGWEGSNCEKDINECLKPMVCLGNGECRNRNGSYECLCGRRNGILTTGNNCELTTSYCQHEFGLLKEPACGNGGTCIDMISGFRCICAPGFTGSRCKINIDECESSPCQHGGSCDDGINGYNCSCIPGITGSNCETNIDECASHPCLNNGVCTDFINRYTCNCSDTGFKGLTCGENIDDCISSPCQHGGSCQDGIKKYTCNCYAGYTGINCETDINECNSYPCQNSGTCLQKSNLTLYNTHYPGFVDFSYSTAAGYVCKCVLGFNGKNCENNIDDCENNTCQNGATCRDGINMYTCDCAPGYKGEKCATEIDECEIQPCKNGASCTDLIADYRCSCLPFVRGSKNYGGKNCTVILTGCDHGNRCQNDAKCVPFLQNELLNIHNYTCKCQSGWTGHFCSISTTITFAHGSHVSKIGLGDIDISLRFQTTLTEAVIVFVRVKLSEFVAMEIHDGRLQLMHGNSTHIFKQESVQSRLRVVDADWHLVHLTVKNNLTLALESSLCTFPEQCTISMVNELQPVTVESKLFIGNTDTTTSLQATVSKTAYTGCLEDVVLNNNYIIPSNQDVVFTNVSSGCPRTVQCDPYTCSRHGNCIDLWNQFKCDCHRPFLGTQCKKEYTAATFAKANISSWASFIIPAAERPELEISLKMSLFVLTRQSDGIIMYLGNSNRNNLTFIILQVASGKLAVEIYLCGSQEVIETTIDYTDGRKHFLSLELVHNTVSFLVDESIIENKTLNQPSCNLKGEFVYFGGRLPDLANRRRRKRAAIPDFSNRPNFQGVVQDPELNGKKLQFFQVVPAIDKTINMTNSSNIAEGAKSTLSACQSNPCQQNGTCQDKFYNDFICLCPYGFRGKTCSELDFCQRIQCPGTGTTCKSLADGYECIIDSTFNGANSLATYKASISSSLKISEISFKLRTTIMFGTILYLSKDDVFLKLRIANKKLELNYKTSPGMSASVYLHHELNDGKKYTINMIFNTNIVLQILFSDKIIEERKFDSELATTLKSLIHNDPVITVGGVAVGALWEKSFKGCLEEVRIGGILLPFFYNSQFENFTNTNTFNATSLTALTDGCMNTGACVGNACKNRAVCTPKWYSYTCDCGSGFAGQFCEARDRCVGVDCQNGGTCLQHLGQCRCRTGYSGNRCETAEGCTSSSCLHNGSCVNMSEGFKCQCTEEFTGQKCETSIKQNCSSSLCNNGSCTDITVNITGTEIQSFNCTCFPGYTGSLCDIEIDYCDSSPCQNGGNCTSSNGTYTCSCKDGFNGTNCENSIVCSNLQPCQNDGTCFGKEDGGWICNCTGGWGGDNCTVNHNVCNESQPCQHGKCSDSTSDYFCNCTGTGYSGTHCESDVDECNLPNPPCQNKATCNNTEGNYTCNCNTGYSGHNCDIPSCNHTECQNNSTCQTNQTRWECNCLQYYEGETCGIAGPCLNNNCSEGGMLRCEQNITENTYRCICKKGWEGQSCGRDINECNDASLCLNGGTCRNFDGGYSCSCSPGFTGLHCETNINECENHPCKNGGDCIDNINGYTCNCTKNFKGRNCTDDVDECTSQLHSCNDSEKCMNTNGSFYCQCKESFINHSGVCIEDPCLKATCENGGTCNRTSGENGGLVYVCTCLDGYEGSHCEKKMQTDELNMWYIIGPIVAIVLIIIIIVVIVFLMVARTKRATRGTYSPSRQETSGSRVELGNVLKKPPEERLI